MQKNHSASPIKKSLPAVIAALMMTIFIVLATLVVGVNAIFNQNISSAQAANPGDTQANNDEATIQDLQATIAQYQARELQYKNELQQAADQVSLISQQNQKYQELIQALQNAGVIQINTDGRVFIPRQRVPSSGFDDD